MANATVVAALVSVTRNGVHYFSCSPAEARWLASQLVAAADVIERPTPPVERPIHPSYLDRVLGTTTVKTKREGLTTRVDVGGGATAIDVYHDGRLRARIEL